MKTRLQTTLRKIARPVLFGSISACAVALLVTSNAQAETYYWDVDGSGTPGFDTVVGAWNTGLFWNSDITGGAGGTTTASPTFADDLNIVQATTTNTGTISVAAGRAASSITFASGVGAVTFASNSITIGGTGTASGIFNNSASNQTFTTGLILRSGTTDFNYTNSSTGLLTIGTTTGAASIAQTLTVGSSSTGSITLQGPNNGATGGTVAVKVNNTGAGITTFSAAGTYTGGLLIQRGEAYAANGLFGGATNVISLGDGTVNADAILRTNNGTIARDIIVNSVSAGTLFILGGTTNNSSGISGTITLNNNVTLASTSVATNGRNMTVSNIISSNGTQGVTYGVSTSNNANSNLNAVVLTAASTYSGTSTISFGVLQLGDGTSGKDGTIANSLSIVNNSALRFNRFGDLSYGGVISGTGFVTKTGVGSETLTGANSYSGVTNVQQGNLIAGTNSLASTNGAFGNAASEINLGIAGGNLSAGILIGGAFNVGRDIRLLTTNNSDIGTRVLTLGGNTAHNSEFSGNIILGTNGFAGRGVTLTAADGGKVTISGVIQNPTLMDAPSYIVTKAGEGTVVLTNTNTYTGATSAIAGTLEIGAGGSTAALSAVTVSNLGTALVVNGTINGTLNANVNTTVSGSAGTIVGAATINGTLSPGTGTTPGATLTFSSTLTLGADSILAFGLGTTSDLIDFTTASDNLIGSGTAVLNLTLLDGFSYANTYTIFQDTTTSGFTLEGITGYDTNLYTANFSDTGNNYDLSFTAVPEPNTALLGALGVLALLRRRR